MSREEIIQELEKCIADARRNMAKMEGIFITADEAKEIVKLLKVKEPRPPIVKQNAYGWKFYYFPSCGREFYTNRAYTGFCDRCGQAVKWNEGN